jgi:hypothetical protein
MKDLFFQRAVQILEGHDGVRLDANETAFLERELTQLRTKIFEVVYPDMLGRRFVPMATDIAASAEKYAFKVWDKVGKAKVAANDSDDAPRIDVTGKELNGKVYPVIASYGWGLNELREAIRTNTPLQSQRALAARSAIETGIDEMLANGYTDQPGETNLVTKGLLNNADVEGLGYATLTNWTQATAATTIENELNAWINGIISGSKQKFLPTNVLLPPSRHEIINTKRVGVDNDTTIKASFLKNNPHIKAIDPWWRLEGIGTNSTGRGLVYQKDPLVLEGVVPVDFEQLPPQARNFEFIVNCFGRCGGVKVYQPLAMKYGDFPA